MPIGTFREVSSQRILAGIIGRRAVREIGRLGADWISREIGRRAVREIGRLGSVVTGFQTGSGQTGFS